jgi:HEAT repeat protein
MKRFFQGVVVVTLVLAAGLLAATNCFAQSDEEAKKLFKEGIDLYQQGQYKEAFGKLESALAKNPSQEVMLFLLDDMGTAALVQMLSNPDLHDTALRTLEAMKLAQRKLESTPEKIAELITGLEAAEMTDRIYARMKLAAIGQRAAAQLVEILRDEKADTLRAEAILTMRDMSDEAVLPLIEALNSNNSFLRQNAAVTLGIIKDKRGVAELKRVCEEGSELPEVKERAMDSIEKITGLPYGECPPAKDCYVDLADKFYKGHPSVMRSVYGDYVIWRWSKSEDKLTLREVPQFAYNEELAEEAAYDGLAIDEEYEPLWSVLTCTLMAKSREAKLAWKAAEDALAAGKIQQADFDKIKEYVALGPLDKAIPGIAHKKHLYSALAKCLDEGNADVGELVLDEIAKAGSFDDLPLELPNGALSPADQAEYEYQQSQRIGIPLVEALLHPDDKRFRYAAALAIMKMNAKWGRIKGAYTALSGLDVLDNEVRVRVETEVTIGCFAGYLEVVRQLGAAAGESTIKKVVLGMSGDSERKTMKKALLRLNCFTDDASAGAATIQKAKAFPQADLIILDRNMAAEAAFVLDLARNRIVDSVFQSLRADTRTKDKSIIIICAGDEMDAAKAAFGEDNVRYIARGFDTATLGDEVFSTEEWTRTFKARADEVAKAAAEALATIDKDKTIFKNYRDAVDPLVSVLPNRPDSVRIPAARALGRFGDVRALDGLMKAMLDKVSAKDTRAEFGKAMAEIFRLSSAQMSNEIYEGLTSCLLEDEPVVAEAAADAFGNADLTDNQRRELIQLRRLRQTK